MNDELLAEIKDEMTAQDWADLDAYLAEDGPPPMDDLDMEVLNHPSMREYILLSEEA